MTPSAMPLRLFIALELPDSVKAQLAALQIGLPGAAWVKPSAMHLTLKFLGDGIEPGRVPALIDALAAIHAPPFALTVAGVGCFPPGNRPARVLWAGLHAPPDLPALAEAVERVTVPLGFPREDRPFSPHLTLARFKHGGGGPELTRFLAANAALRSEPFAITHVDLMASKLQPQGPQYTRLLRVDLHGG